MPSLILRGLKLRGVAKDAAGLDLEIADRERLVLFGAGRELARVLRAVAGLEAEQAGEVLLGERALTVLAPEKRDVALVFANGALYPHLTVRENLSFALAARGLKRDEIDARVGDAMQRLALEPLLDRRPSALSAEECVRVAFARALARRPALLLVDDPLAVLEPGAVARTLLSVLAAIRHLGVTTLYATARSDVAMALGQRVAAIEDGRVAQLGAPLDLYERPATRRLAATFGASPMNELELACEGGQVKLGGAAIPVPCSDARVVVAVRPEHLSLAPASKGELALEGLVEAVMPAAAGSLVTVELGGRRLVAAVDAHAAPRVGDSVVLSVAPRRLRFFDAGASGAALSWEPPPGDDAAEAPDAGSHARPPATA